MIRQCAWCRRVFGEAPPFNDVSATHGVCTACHEQFLAPHMARLLVEEVAPRDGPPPAFPLSEAPR